MQQQLTHTSSVSCHKLSERYEISYCIHIHLLCILLCTER